MKLHPNSGVDTETVVPLERVVAREPAAWTGPPRTEPADIKGFPPLCVDLDGTLLKTDLLFESLARVLRDKPWLLVLLAVWLLRGKAALKRELAQRITLNAASLPYHQPLIAWLRGERSGFRELWLVTGADEILARKVADHHGIFHRVLASDGRTNLTGERKLAALRQAAAGPFIYVGNSQDDLAVWRHAEQAIAVRASSGVAKKLRAMHPKALVLEENVGPRWKSYAKALRVQQWPKNVLIFLPMIASHKIWSPEFLWKSALGALLFSLCSSAQYILNDLMDLDADRQHSAKRARPFASGDLQLSTGFVMAPLLLLASLAGAYWLTPAFAWLLAGYFALSFSYSMYFKRIVLLDVFLLSGLYILRIVGGHLVTRIAFSEWLFSFVFFLFLSLALSKRWMELRTASSQGIVNGRGYHAVDAAQVNLFGACSAFLSAVVFLLYLQSEKVKELYRTPGLLWMLVPVYLYWLTRVWILNGRGNRDEDPVAVVLRDPASYAVALICALILVAASADLRSTIPLP